MCQGHEVEVCLECLSNSKNVCVVKGRQSQLDYNMDMVRNKNETCFRGLMAFTLEEIGSLPYFSSIANFHKEQNI